MAQKFRVTTDPEDSEYNEANKPRIEGNIIYFFDLWDHERAVQTEDLVVDNLDRWIFTSVQTGKKFTLTPVKE